MTAGPAASLGVLTVTYAPDLPLFEDLHASVMRFTDDSVHFDVVVEDEDLELFRRFANDRCRVRTVSDVLPRTFRSLPGSRLTVNLRRPWPPLRGWIRQQLVKLVAVSTSPADLVLMMDSDVALVRPVSAGSFSVEGRPNFYRLPGGVHAGMARHVIWHRVAERLLGLPEEPLPMADYVDSFNVWSPAIVRELAARIEQQTHRRWETAFSANLHVSEFILYGVFVDRVLGADAPVNVVPRMGSHNYWDEEPLDRDAALEFARGVTADDVAMMLSAKSRTPLEIRREALALAQQVANR